MGAGPAVKTLGVLSRHCARRLRSRYLRLTGHSAPTAPRLPRWCGDQGVGSSDDNCDSFCGVGAWEELWFVGSPVPPLSSVGLVYSSVRNVKIGVSNPRPVPAASFSWDWREIHQFSDFCLHSQMPLCGLRFTESSAVSLPACISNRFSLLIIIFPHSMDGSF